MSFKNKVKEQPIMLGLDVKEISRNSLVVLPKKVNIANIIGSKDFENGVHEKLVVSLLVVKVYKDSLVELLEEVSAILKEFQDSCHFKFPNSSTSMLNTQLVIDFKKPFELPNSSISMLDIQHAIDFKQPPKLSNVLSPVLEIQHVISLEQSAELPESLPLHDKEDRDNPNSLGCV
jgi:hypothetical protein